MRFSRAFRERSKRAMAESGSVEVSYRTRAAAFRKRHRAGVENHGSAPKLFQLGDVSVAVGEDASRSERRQRVFVPAVPVSQEETFGSRV